MKKIFFFTAVFLAFGSVEAQEISLKFDHQALLVDDLEVSATFYGEVLGLQEIVNQTQNPLIRWYVLSDQVELHLIQRSKEGIQLKKDVHMALAVSDLDRFMVLLREKDVAFENWAGEPDTSNTRPDGVRQIYLQDPDGYWIEINTAARF